VSCSVLDLTLGDNKINEGRCGSWSHTCEYADSRLFHFSRTSSKLPNP
jgi:hypothetical protein